MHEVDAKRYRRAVARINYMSQDRCDLSSASKVLTQSMANPRAGDEALVKRVIRYLRRFPRSVNFMQFQEWPNKITVMIDSDWAGEITSRRSTSDELATNEQTSDESMTKEKRGSDERTTKTSLRN